MSSASSPSLPPPLSPSPTSAPSSSRPSISSQQRTANAKAAFVASLQNVGRELDSELTSRAKNIHDNAKVLSEQEKKLVKSTKQLQKDTVQVEKFLEKSKKGGKGPMSEFDDLEDILGNLEGELDVLERTLGYVEGDVDDQEEEFSGEGSLALPGSDLQPEQQKRMETSGSQETSKPGKGKETAV